MEIYVMDAFSDRIFGGNQAGVALPERELPDGTMQAVAAEMKHSETAFVRLAPDGVHLRYFTPAGEVDLCGHATVGSFALLRALGKIGDGMHTAHTRAGTLRVEVAGGTVWMDMAPPKLLQTLPQDALGELYAAYGLTESDRPAELPVEIISTGPCRHHDARARPGDAPARRAGRDGGNGTLAALRRHGRAHVLPWGRVRLLQQLRPAL